MLSIGYNLFNIGHCIFLLLFVSILKKKSPSYLSCCCHAVYLWTDISQPTVFWSRYSLVAVVDHVRCWSCSECSRGTKQLLVDMLWRLLLLCATDCRPIWVLTGCSHIYCQSCSKCSRRYTCRLSLAQMCSRVCCCLCDLKNWVVCSLASHSCWSVSTSLISLFHLTYWAPYQATKMLSSLQQQSNWKLMVIEKLKRLEWTHTHWHQLWQLFIILTAFHTEKKSSHLTISYWKKNHPIHPPLSHSPSHSFPHNHHCLHCGWVFTRLWR